MSEDTPDYALWLDIETTGLGSHDYILEVATMLTRMTPDFEELDAFETVILNYVSLHNMSEYALNTHARNGLLDEIVAGHGMPLVKAERTILNMIDQHTKGLVVLAGSGVSHFDHQFIRTRMPGLHERLTYYDLDIGCVNRLAKLSGIETGGGDHSHRARMCLREALDQARLFGQYFSRCSPKVGPLGDHFTKICQL